MSIYNCITCSFSDSNLENIIKCSSKCSFLSISSCKLNLESALHFSGPTYNLKTISFASCGTAHRNMWAKKPENFNRIIKAIAESSLRDSLETIGIFECGITVKTVKKMLIDYQIDHINVSTK